MFQIIVKIQIWSSNSWSFVFFNVLGLNSQADAPASATHTLKRAFSLLESSTQEESSGSAIPIHQIISLVSMTSPRTFRPHKVSTSPAFVEFNTSESGYGWVIYNIKYIVQCSTAKGGTKWSPDQEIFKINVKYCCIMCWYALLSLCHKS